MQAVMNQEVDRAYRGQQARKAPSAGALDVGPLIGKTVAHRDTDLRMPCCIERRILDAPQMPAAIASQGLKNDPRSHPVTNAGFDDLGGPLVLDQAPNGPQQSKITVIPPLVTHRADANSLSLKLCLDLSPNPPKLRRCWAGRRCIQQFVEPPFPVRVCVIQIRGGAIVTIFSKSFPKCHPGLKWV